METWMAHKLNRQDEGKPIVTPHGDTLGVLDRVDAGNAYVRPNPGLLAGYGSWITGPMRDVESFRLNEESVAKIDSDRVVIKEDTTLPSRFKGL